MLRPPVEPPIDERFLDLSVRVPIGTVINWVGREEYLPLLEKRGWLVCDGSPLASNEFPLLYPVIGKLHGAGHRRDDPSENEPGADFNLPDLRAMFLRGVAMGKKLDPEVSERRVPFGSLPPDQDRAGSTQRWATGDPNLLEKPFKTLKDGEHQHTVDCGKVVPHDSDKVEGGDDHKLMHTQAGGNAIAGKSGSEHEHKIIGGSKETRPDNSYVFFLIRAI